MEGNDYLIMTGPWDTFVPINVHGPGGPFVIEVLRYYSAQQESFAGSLRREMAIIFSASAIVG
jgi:hypothetical protein